MTRICRKHGGHVDDEDKADQTSAYGCGNPGNIFMWESNMIKFGYQRNNLHVQWRTYLNEEMAYFEEIDKQISRR